VAESRDKQAKYRQFIELLPMTLAVAGLPPSEPGKHFTDDQVESRLMTFRKAYRASLLCAKELVD